MKNFGTMQAAIGESQKSGKSDPNHHSPHLNIYPFFPLFMKKKADQCCQLGEFCGQILNWFNLFRKFQRVISRSSFIMGKILDFLWSNLWKKFK